MEKKQSESSAISWIFFLAAAAAVLCILLVDGGLGVSLAPGILLMAGFVALFLITAISLRKYHQSETLRRILVNIGLGILLVSLPKALFSSWSYSLKMAPLLLSLGLGLGAGYLYFIMRRWKWVFPALLFLVPVSMGVDWYDGWVQEMEFGKIDGTEQGTEELAFTLRDQQQKVIDQHSFQGKITLFDFWFINCGPCWRKFPKLQRIYEQYQDHPKVQVFAINRPMRGDEPGAAFRVTREKEYTFPVLQANAATIATFEIRRYPTVVLLNEKGELIFKGRLEAAAEEIERLLKQN